MTDDRNPERPERPVVTGLIALAAVALAVGLVLAGVTLIATRMVGLGGDPSAASGGTQRESLYLPKPEKTTSGGPQVTLNTSEGAEPTGEATETETEPTESKSPEKVISLSAGQTTVPNFGQIDLTGTYPGGEGAILQVQRFQGGQWADFGVTASVSGGTFSTYVQTGVTGVNRFRVIDSATGEASNEVRVTVQS